MSVTVIMFRKPNWKAVSTVQRKTSFHSLYNTFWSNLIITFLLDMEIRYTELAILLLLSDSAPCIWSEPELPRWLSDSLGGDRTLTGTDPQTCTAPFALSDLSSRRTTERPRLPGSLNSARLGGGPVCR